MSATNRGATSGYVRPERDFFETPIWVTEAVIPHLPAATRIIDPCAGRGKILDVIGKDPGVWGLEIDQEHAVAAAAKGHTIVLRDSLSAAPWGEDWRGGACANHGRPELVVMNPAYVLALEFVLRAIGEVGPRGTVAALLRLAFLESADRVDFHLKHPSDVKVLSRRPSFCMSCSCGMKPKCGWNLTLPVEAERPKVCGGCGRKVSVSTSDASAYAWFIWGPGRGGNWEILPPKEGDGMPRLPDAIPQNGSQPVASTPVMA